MSHTLCMSISQYEIEGIAYTRADGPMWRTMSADGTAALLTLHTQSDADQFLERWKKWASIHHPNVVRLIDVISHEDGRWALIQSHIAGDTLAIHMENNTELLRVHREKIQQCLRAAVEELHRHGIIHGDLSPGNIILEANGNPVIIDLIGETIPHRGTPGWSSIEQTEETDKEALERIISSLPYTSRTPVPPAQPDPSDPGVRLRAHNELPVTERCETQRRWRRITRPEQRQEKHGKRNSKRPALSPAHILIIGACTSTMIALWGVNNMWAADTQEDLPSPQELTASEMALGAQTGVQLENSAQSVTSRKLENSSQIFSNYGNAEKKEPTSTESYLSCPQQHEIIEIINKALLQRDRAYNDEPHAIDEVLGGDLLESERQVFAELHKRGTRIHGFTTHLQLPTLIECNHDEIRVHAKVTSEPYRICSGEECHDVKASDPNASPLRIVLNMRDKKLVRVEEIPQPAHRE